MFNPTLKLEQQFSFVNATKIYQFKPKDSEIKKSLAFRNISGDFLDNSMKKTGLNGCVYDFSVDFKAFDISDFNNIHKYLIKSRVIK